MTKEDRHEFILSQLQDKDIVFVNDLAHMLNVSLVTIRKDLTEMETNKQLYRVHGGARKLNPFANNRSVSEKEKLAREEKRVIGIEAAKLVTADDSIAIGSGTTVHAFARAIQPLHRLTAVSASLIVSDILADNESIDVIQLGGMLRHSSRSVVGRNAEDALSGFAFSKCYLGVDGIDFDFGITTTDVREAELNQCMIQSSQRTIILADSSKFGKRGFSKICNLQDIDLIITDAGATPQIVSKLEELGIEVIIAK
ncbi:MAG: DeoR/GlpR transcriptional regulator [Muribaculaceae bacterium]|nr:DeoR/GlpR transcriptional regulator [Muribaculaceae bacterium]